MYNTLLLVLSAHVYFASAGTPSIVQPCKLSDYQCIGKTLAANSACKPRGKGGFLAPKYQVDTLHYDTPYFNASYVDKNLIVRNQDKCFVSAFFINRDSNRAVLTLDCPNLDLESDRTCIQHKSMQEDSYFYFHIRGTYPMIRITVNFLDASQMELCSSYIYTDVTALPKLHIDPQNKPTARALSKDLSLLNIYERENCHARGPSLAYVFIDALICQFGCPVPK